MAAVVVFNLLCLLSVAASDDLQTLFQIKAAFQHSNPKSVLDSWVPDDAIACEFPGITCSPGGFVAGIDLSRQNLRGAVPFNSICQLKSLEKLSLGWNQLSGRVPEDLNNCSSLKYLDLGNNFFSGPFPDISAMDGLVYLYANASGFSGVFPWKSLSNMTHLQVLSIGDNPFDRTPFPREVVNLTQLKRLYLSNCSIEGEIPEEIGNLAGLIDLELSMNYISGEIPRGITKLSSLRQLELYSNSLTGELPAGMKNLTTLEFLDASSNNLRSNLSEIRFLNKLKSLQLYQNQFSGEIPAELGDFKNLVNLSLYTNNLTGPIPQKLGSWAEVNFIDVSENFLTGPIPPDMCRRGTMKKLLVLQNNLTGEIPSSYANCTTLLRFRVNDNSLSGQVPDGIWGLPNAEIIDVAGNDLEGSITSNIKNAKSLAQLFVANNRLSGELPHEISQASSLVSIDLSNNHFSGPVPDTIADLKQLTSLQLQVNNFSGLIPNSLGSCRSINDINIACNELSGPIPGSLGNLPALNFLNLSRNGLSGPIPGALANLRLNLLDLSVNHLSGPIPVSLLSEENNGSFSGNNGLCSRQSIITGFRPCSNKSVGPQVRTLMLGLLLACVVLLAALAGFCYTRRKEEDLGSGWSLKNDSWYLKSFRMLTFTEDEILDSIRPENLIGKGGSGNVYRVTVGNGKEFAVKHIWHSGCPGKMGGSTQILGRCGPEKSREFEAEVQALSSIRHINVVKLYCSISSDYSSLLVYEYMANGSLWDRLHNCNKLGLDWEMRYEIAVGAAKGLEYLHHGCDRPVIHRDVKSSNILLDEYLKPRIADFGLARIVQGNPNKESSYVVAGTHGYIAPEYAYTNKVNEKSDVYSFGVVLMELVTGKRPMEAEFGENKDIVDWVCRNLETKESIVSLVDPAIEEIHRGSAIEVLKVAIRCTATLPTLRPTMRTAVHMLEKADPSQFVSILVTKDDRVK
ncbi:Leucine-rich receptor-like protein kinase family protein [Striga hermonthica]|uniref:Leucine-rich receptor-like protein kinase family protein n=1 Tax=Striga hermonthica TaxID=68872 RepID=A0A9N7MF50_STRHE|nr:Leucine-rich receptor-like protein kinase family protein [Striga hermonthica]